MEMEKNEKAENGTKACCLCQKLRKKVKLEACQRKHQAVTDDSVIEKLTQGKQSDMNAETSSFNGKEHVFRNTERHKRE